MATMSDDGEKTCPLCAEEMDLTDQQLKPCKCGYEICVWCWHHIIEMAEKEDAEGRCPACRTPYDKERIVGMAASCERVVAEVSTDKKPKPQRTKTKISMDTRKHLNGVRVIKRNLVYIIGLPNNLADESILERKEYFGQYGKVLKVSISRQTNTSSAAPPLASSGSTFGVYITYAREEEAIRCIQVVNNFVLEGNPLRACFGTTKYCHIWLRNMTCTNPHCLYLHDVDCQEDSLTKDEMLSDYTRSKIPESGLSHLQQRSGHILPPPVDETSNTGAVSWKNILKNSNNTSVQLKGSTSISCKKSPVLPAAASWGSRVSNCRPPVPSTASSQNPVKQKVDVVGNQCRLSSTDTSTKQSSSSHDNMAVSSKIPRDSHTHTKSRSVESIKLGISRDSQATASNVSSETLVDGAHVSKISSWDDDIMIFKVPEGVHEEISFRTVETSRSGDRDITTPVDVSMDKIVDDACRSAWDDDEVTITQVPEERKTTQMDDNARPSDPVKPSIDRDRLTSVSDRSLKSVTNASYTAETLLSLSSSPSACLTELKDENIAVLGDNVNLVNNMCPETSEKRLSGPVLDEVAKACLGLASVNLDDCLLLDHSSDQDKNSVSIGIHKNLGSSLRNYSPEHDNGCMASASFGRTSNYDAYNSRGLTDRNSDQQVHVLASNGTVMEDSLLGYDRNQRLSPISDKPSCLVNGRRPLAMFSHSSNSFWNDKADDSCLLFNGYARTLEAEVDMKPSSFRENGPALNTPKEEPSNSVSHKEAQNLGRSDGVSNIGKIASVDTGESSIISDILSLDFDPWDVSLSSANNFEKLLGVIDKQDGPSKLPSTRKLQNSNQSRFSFARQENQSDIDTSIMKTADTHRLFSSSEVTDSSHNIPQLNRFDASVNVRNGISTVSPDTMPGTVRGKFSTPPGFSVPSRAPPPGFSSHDRYGSSFETCSENRLLGHSSLQNQYQGHLAKNASDVEFIDPAILAVGKGILPLGVNNSGFGSRYALPTQFSTSNNDLTLQLLKQQAIAAHQELRVSEHIGERFLPLNDAYISSRHLAQTHMQSPFAQLSQQPNGSHILGSQWDVWNGTSMSSDTPMAEVLRNERFGLVNGYSTYNGEHTFHRPTSGDLYNRALGR